MKGVRDVDRGWKRMLAVVASGGGSVTVGVQGDDASEIHPGSDITVVRLAGVHEFGAQIQTSRGTITIPERSFLRSTFDEHRERYERAAGKLGRAVLAGAVTPTQALAILGERAASDVKRTIEKGIDPPLAETTIARKGSSKPLIDTGHLKNSITYAVPVVGGFERGS